MKNKDKISSTKIPSWQVKGVAFETREAVKIAARRQGLTIGEWVNETLHSAAVATISGKPNLPAHRIEDQLESISARLDAIQRPFWKTLFRKS